MDTSNMRKTDAGTYSAADEATPKRSKISAVVCSYGLIGAGALHTLLVCTNK